MAKSSIEWTEMTWNPTTGCSKISDGCKFCYAEVMTRRLQAMGQTKYKDGFNVIKIHPETLVLPSTWTTPKRVFVDSMSDLFHPDIPVEFIQQVFMVMNNHPQHIFQVLTKRANRLFEIHKVLSWTPNIWMGVTVENEKVIDRIAFLTKTNANIKFLSLEPLIGPLNNLNLNGIHWVIVGGESGVNARLINPQWIMNIKKQCDEHNVAFFFKQWGTWGEDGIKRNKKENGRLLEGKIYNDIPTCDMISYFTHENKQ